MAFLKITFRESGGFAGLVRGCELDSSSLPPAAAAALDALLAGAQAPSRASRGARDLVTYEITVGAGKGARTVALGETNVPEAVRPLIAHLCSRSGPRPLP